MIRTWLRKAREYGFYALLVGVFIVIELWLYFSGEREWPE